MVRIVRVWLYIMGNYLRIVAHYVSKSFVFFVQVLSISFRNAWAFSISRNNQSEKKYRCRLIIRCKIWGIKQDILLEFLAELTPCTRQGLGTSSMVNSTWNPTFHATNHHHPENTRYAKCRFWFSKLTFCRIFLKFDIFSKLTFWDFLTVTVVFLSKWSIYETSKENWKELNQIWVFE